MSDHVNERVAALSRTERQIAGEHWYVLDNAAAFMPALTSPTQTLVFRISATLTERVHLPSLQLAMANLAPRFPYFLVELRHGFFWYYLEPTPGRVPQPVADSRYPCMHLHARRRGQLLYRVRPFGSRIAVEFCHVLTDGSGALIYIRALLVEYLRLRGVDCPDAPGVFRPADTPAPEESEDSFHRWYQPGVPFPPPVAKAFHAPVRPLAPGTFRIITGEVPLAGVVAKTKEYGVSVTEFAAALYLASLQDLYHSLPPSKRRHRPTRLAVEVPINLRKLFPSSTLRNFTLYVTPSLDTRLGLYDFDEIVRIVHLYMQAEVNRKSLSRQISRNVAGGRSMVVRLMPLFIKALAAHWVFKNMGEDTVSGIVTNMGLVELPPPVASRIKSFEFIPAPSRRLRSNAYLISWKDTLYVTFGSTTSSTELERLFFKRLTAMGLSVVVQSNG